MTTDHHGAPARRRYVIIGAGAIGGGIGGLLAAHDIATTLVARGEHLARMRRDGLRLRLPEATHTVPVEAIGGPDEIELTPDDVLVLATKTHQAEAALAAWADAPVGEQTAGSALPLLTALNGVRAESLALRWFARVFGVCVWMPAVMVTPGEVIVRAAPRRAVLHTARVPAELTDDRDRALLQAVAADWASAGLSVPLPADVMAWKYRKLLGNLANAVQALLGPVEDVEDIVAAVRAEAQEIYAASGVVMNAEAEEHEHRSAFSVQPVPGAPEVMGGSTWQSMTRGSGSTEVDFLNGEIVAMAHALGRSAPVNQALARLTRRASAEGWSPGELGVDDLRTALGLPSLPTSTA